MMSQGNSVEEHVLITRCLIIFYQNKPEHVIARVLLVLGYGLSV